MEIHFDNQKWPKGLGLTPRLTEDGAMYIHNPYLCLDRTWHGISCTPVRGDYIGGLKTLLSSPLLKAYAAHSKLLVCAAFLSDTPLLLCTHCEQAIIIIVTNTFVDRLCH